jgi:hypothetical protein
MNLYNIRYNINKRLKQLTDNDEFVLASLVVICLFLLSI